MALVTLVSGPGPGILEGLEALLPLLLLSLAFAAFGWVLLCLCCFPEAWMPGSLDAQKPGYPEVRMPGSLDAQESGCLFAAPPFYAASAAAAVAAAVPTYLHAQKPGCPEAWMPRSLDAQKP